jgi:inosine-uridine nucleoside N-ribohydrolase
LTRKDAARLDESTDAVARFVAAISEPYLRFAERFGPGGAAIHDALAVGIAIDPLVAKIVKSVHVDVETKGEFTYGATVTNRDLTVEHSEWRGDRFVLVDFPRVQANAAYPAVVDGERFVQMFLKRMMRVSAGGR